MYTLAVGICFGRAVKVSNYPTPLKSRNHRIPFSTQISLTLSKRLDIRPPLHRIRQLPETRIILQPLHALLRQILIVQDLIEHQIRVRDRLAEHIRARAREFVSREVSLEGVQEADALGLLVFGIRLFFLGVEKGVDELGPPWPVLKNQSLTILLR